MKNNILKFTASLFFLLTLYSRAAVHDDAATSSFQFLHIIKAPAALASGEAWSARQGDMAAVFYNPAGTYSDSRFSGFLNYSRWMLGVSAFSLAGRVKSPAGDFGLVFSAYATPESQLTTWYDSYIKGHEYVTRAAGMMGIINWSRTFFKYLSGGINLKLLSEKTAEFNPYRRTFLADTGILMHFSMLKWQGLALGISVFNIGPGDKKAVGDFAAPLGFRSGINFKFNLNDRTSFALMTDIEKTRSFPFSGNFGLDFTFLKNISILAGYRTSKREFGFSTGISAGFDAFKIQYGIEFTPIEAVNHIGISFNSRKSQKNEGP